MSEILSNNQEEIGANNFQPKPDLATRIDQNFLEKNAWKKLNGGCPISADLETTLQLLKANVHPLGEDLPELVRTSVAKYAQNGQTIEQVWAQKIAEGANFIGVVEGVFGFYRGEEKLATPNKPLEIAVLPTSLEFRLAEKRKVYTLAAKAREKLKNSLRAHGAGFYNGFGVSSTQV